MHARTMRFAVAALVLSAPLLAAPARGAEEPLSGEALFEEKCSLCHSSHRAVTVDPAKIKEVVARMRSLNPDWISTIESDHIVEVVAKLADAPAAISSRQAMREAVARGEVLFKDTTLGKKGVACASCHKPEKFRQIGDTYPRWDPKLKNFVGLDEAIRIMLRDKVGADPAPGDQRVMDLLLYLKTR